MQSFSNITKLYWHDNWLPLCLQDKLTHLHEIKEKVDTPEGVPRLFDLVKVKDEKLKLAFYNVLGNTLVANNLDQVDLCFILFTLLLFPPDVAACYICTPIFYKSINLSPLSCSWKLLLALKISLSETSYSIPSNDSCLLLMFKMLTADMCLSGFPNCIRCGKRVLPRGHPGW